MTNRTNIMKTRLSLLLTGLLTALLAAGCGGGDDNQPGGGQPGAPAADQSTSATGGDSDAPAREIVIEGNDQMQFNIENFNVQPGERIRLKLDNVGTMPKFSMGHNIVVLTLEADEEAFVEAAMNAAGNDYIPADREHEIIAHTKLLGGGEEDSVTFTAPEEPGAYPFICSFPGHYQIGMKGTMTVQ